MKILLIGDADSQFIYNYVKWLKKLDPNILIDIFSTRPEKQVKQEYQKCYNKIYFPYKNTFLPEDLKYFRIIFKPLLTLLNLNKITNHYDIVHILHIHPFYRFGRKKIIRLGANVIGSIWGTDFNRLNKKGIKRIEKLYRSFDVITLSNKTIKDRLLNFIPDIKDRIRCLNIGIAPIEQLHSIMQKYTKEEAKKIMGFNKNKISITIGYSSKVIHQHVKIINLFEKSEELLKRKSKIELILPITYGPKGGYKKKIIKMANNSSYKFFIFKDFLSNEETALLRYSTDIMLQLSTTDHASGSIREYFYAKTLVVAGSWLPYEPWKQEKIYFEEIDHLDKLEEKLIDIIDNWNREQVESKLEKTKNIVFKMSSWGYLAPKWLDIYKDLTVGALK